MISLRLTSCFVMITSTACGLFKNPTTLAEQAKAARESETTNDSWIGQLDGSFTAVDGHERASSTQDIALHYSGRSEDGKACVTIEKTGQITAGDGDEVVAKWVKGIQSMTIVWEMRDSLELPNNTAWAQEPSPSSQTLRVVSQKASKERHKRSDGTYWSTDEQSATIELCAPAAVPRRSSRYLTLTRFKHGETPAFYAWKLDPSSVTDADAAARAEAH